MQKIRRKLGANMVKNCEQMEQTEGHDFIRPMAFSTSRTRIAELWKLKKKKGMSSL